MKRFNLTLLILIIFLGFFLRVVDISNNPRALYGDELTIVYDAYALLLTGKDQTGQSFPLTFSMGAGRPAGYVYFSIPFVAIFGPNALGVRSLSILSGLGIILLLFFLGRRLSNEKVGLAASFLVAVSPWDLSLSRGGFEAHFALFLTLFGVYFFLIARQRLVFYLIAAISFGLTLHTYPTYKLILPLFLPVLIWLEGSMNWYKDRNLFIATLVFLGFAALSTIQTITAGSENRFTNINIFSQQEVSEQIHQKINFERSITELPNSISRFFYNRPLEYFKVLGENYLQNLSLDFLFIHGDRNPRHNMAAMGELYLVELILIFLGIFSLWQKNTRLLIFFLSWLLIAPLGSALLATPHALRSAFMLPPLIILSSYGLVSLWSGKGLKAFLRALFVAGFIIQFIYFTQKLYFLTPNEFSRFWSYPAKYATEKAQENKDRYDYIILSDRIDNIEYAHPVYTKTDPQLVISQYKAREKLGDFEFKRYDSVYIGAIPSSELGNFLGNLDGSVLYIGKAEDKEFLQNYSIKEGLDKSPMLVFYEN